MKQYKSSWCIQCNKSHTPSEMTTYIARNGSKVVHRRMCGICKTKAIARSLADVK